MAGLIRVTPEQLFTASGNVKQGSESINGTLGQLKGQLAPLGTDWAGTASGQFAAAYAKWEAGARALNEALTEISGLLGNAGGQYETNESSVAGLFRS